MAQIATQIENYNYQNETQVIQLVADALGRLQRELQLNKQEQ